MLRRSLILVLAVALLALAFTAAYAILPVRSPEDLLRDASAMVAQGKNLEAAELLDRSESSPAFAQSTDLRRQLWRLRLQAHRSLDVSTRALQDIDNLIQDGDQSVSLQMDRVYYLARLGRGEEARQAGLAIAAAHPKLARAQELAGESCKVAYTNSLRNAASRVRSDVGFESQQQAIAALLEFLYRPEGDPSVAAASHRLREFYLSESRLAQAWPQFQDELAKLRGQVQEASKMFLRALEIAGQDPTQRNAFYAAAFQGVAYSLQQGNRNDDLDAQSEIYLGAYAHRWRTDAAAAAAATRYQDGLFESAVDIAERCAPLETFTADFAANRFTPAIRQLLITRCLALYRLGRGDDLGKLAVGIQKALKDLPALYPVTGLAWGLTHSLANNQQHRTAPLAWFCDVQMRDPSPQDGEDPLDLLMPLLLESMATDGKPASEILAKLDSWASARAGNPLPMHTRARWQIRLDQAAAAMATATSILQERPTDESALRILAEAADLAYKASQQDGASLVVHCLQRNTDRPDSPQHPVCYLLCAEAALKQQHAWIAKACARVAADRYPWSEWPTILFARAEAMLGNPAAAIEALERLIEQRPDADEAVRICFELKAREGLPVRKMLMRAVGAMPGSKLVVAELLRTAIEDDGPSLVDVARRANAIPDADAELLALVATAFAKRDDPVTARAALAKARAATDSSSPRACREILAAEIACLTAESRTTPDGTLADAASRFLATTPCNGPESAHQLSQAARVLASRRHFKTATRLLSAALSASDAIEARDGATHALAGDLAIADGRIAEARAAYTAAVSFEDGASCAERLARLEALSDSPSRAVAALATARKTEDAALSMLLGSSEATKIARERVTKKPEDILAAIPFLMAAGASSDPLAVELRAVPASAQRAALLACSLLEDPMLAPSSSEHAAAAASQAPRCFLIALLHARAMLATGDAANAANTHARLYEEGRRSPLLWSEVARSSMLPGYKAPSSILGELRSVAQKAPTSLGAETLAMLAIYSANEAERLGQPDVALGIRADVWRFYPTASRATAEDADKLRAAGRTVAAVELLFALQSSCSESEREPIARQLYETAILVTQDLAPASLTALRSKASADLAAGVAPGAAFRLLASDPRAMSSLSQEQCMKIARAAVLAACVGKADWSVAEAAILLAQERSGSTGSLSMIEAALEMHPSVPRLWTERARLRHELAEHDIGLDDARALKLCVDDPEFVIELVTLAAQLRRTTTGDQLALRELPASMLSGDRGRLAEGLLALRNGRPDEAEAALSSSRTRTPEALYARALANLMRRSPDARTTARTLFEELRGSYPSSALARNVGSFALQLGPN